MLLLVPIEITRRFVINPMIGDSPIHKDNNVFKTEEEAIEKLVPELLEGHNYDGYAVKIRPRPGHERWIDAREYVMFIRLATSIV